MAISKAKSKKPKKKTMVLNVDGVDLPVTFNENGRLDKKSMDAFNEILNKKLVAKTQLRGRDVVLVGSFIGLTVAYKKGLLDLITPLVGNIALDVTEGDILGAATGAGIFGAAGIGIKAVLDKIEKDGIKRRREMFEKDIKRAEDDIARVGNLLSGATPKADGTAVTEAERARGEAFIVERQAFLDFARVSIPEDDVPLTGRARTEVELIKWSVAMGLSGATIYLLQSHTVSDIIELTPGIQ